MGFGAFWARKTHLAGDNKFCWLEIPWHIGNILVPDQAPNVSGGGGFSPNHPLVYATEEDVGRRTVNSVIGLDCLRQLNMHWKDAVNQLVDEPLWIKFQKITDSKPLLF